ncbi:MAG: thioredoxin domain-containing protein [Comamonadaceae bacterium]|jgi:protein-disulfide isomerase|nr:thioredoxin domain-containing protein [Comamonadaceae bacterium]MBK8358596.1 thioredoxin domain-containing protein [Comamonadaceae bacterium]
MNKRILVVSAGLLALVVFALGVFFYTQQQAQQAAQLAQANRTALVRPHSPAFGNPGAKVTIVEFIDPACETCSAFFPLVKSLVGGSSGQVNLVMRYAPLHKGSDEVVKILEAARMQDLYWPVLQALLKSQSVWVVHHEARPERVWDLIQDTGLDVAKARADMNSPRVAEVVAQDIADGKTLKVTKTPGFFVNGKPLVDFGSDQLKALVAREVRSAYGK